MLLLIKELFNPCDFMVAIIHWWLLAYLENQNTSSIYETLGKVVEVFSHTARCHIDQ